MKVGLFFFNRTDIDAANKWFSFYYSITSHQKCTTRFLSSATSILDLCRVDYLPSDLETIPYVDDTTTFIHRQVRKLIIITRYCRIMLLNSLTSSVLTQNCWIIFLLTYSNFQCNEPINCLVVILERKRLTKTYDLWAKFTQFQLLTEAIIKQDLIKELLALFSFHFL